MASRYQRMVDSLKDLRCSTCEGRGYYVLPHDYSSQDCCKCNGTGLNKEHAQVCKLLYKVLVQWYSKKEHKNDAD